LWIFGFMQIYSEETFTAGLGVSWSLCVEVTFYVMVPIYAAVVARALRGRDRFTAARLELAALGMLAVGSVVFTTVAHGAGAHALAETLPGNFSWFALGMALAVISASGWGEGSRVVRTIVERPVLPWVISAGLLVVAATASGLPGIHEGFPLPYSTADWAIEKVLHGLIALFLLLPAVFGSEHGGAVRRLLAAPALMWVGLVSYGVYLWHGSLIHVYRQYAGELLPGGPGVVFVNLFVVAVAMSLVIAAASYYLLERPAMRLRTGISLAAVTGALPAGVRRVRSHNGRISTLSPLLPDLHGERVLRLSVAGGAMAPRLARASLSCWRASWTRIGSTPFTSSSTRW
jgi:peptidoglycan/LPS O-acetylase OafA/YrhL